MIEMPIPQDILKVKTKVLFGLSTRELIWGGIGCALLLYNLFSTFAFIPSITQRALVACLPSIPFFCIGFAQIHGIAFEKMIIPFLIDNLLSPPIRRKEIHYESLEKREKTRYWLMNEKSKKQKKIKCKKSKQFKEIR